MCNYNRSVGKELKKNVDGRKVKKKKEKSESRKEIDKNFETEVKRMFGCSLSKYITNPCI